MTNNNNHPITPPPELVQQWFDDAKASLAGQWVTHVATQAARWGADTELEACCKWLREDQNHGFGDNLRVVRRPKPPSLKEQALEALKHAQEGWRPVPADCDIIRRALESLPD